jgi:hypothetical protein
MSTSVISKVGRNTENDLLTTGDVSYATFKKAVIALHHQGSLGAPEGDYQSLALGMRLVNEWGNLFPSFATQLADDPEFLS